MKIAHYKKSKIAWAPEALVQCINKYSADSASIVVPPGVSGIVLGGVPVSDEALDSFDVVHFHNRVAPTMSPCVLQYHSPPDVVDIGACKSAVVIAQYQATLPVYRGLKMVRNIVDLYADEFVPKPHSSGRVRVGYSPSVLHGRTESNPWVTKGYPETTAVLRRLEGIGVDVDIIHGVSLAECLSRKSVCDILIDECVTGSYHRCLLEAMALGRVSICWVNDAVMRVFLGASGVSALPFHRVPIDRLFEDITALVTSGKDTLEYLGRECRAWMETYWNPAAIVAEYLSIYRELAE